MKAKYFAGLLPAFILAAGLALAQQPATPPPPPEPPDEPADQNFSFFIDGGGFLGVYAENINRENMGRYNLNQVRGVGVTQVIKDSPAEKAGLRKGDVILRLDGENVSSVRKLNRLVSELAPDQSVRINVSRGGAEQEITATIGKRNNASFAGDVFPGGTRLFKWDGPNMKNWKFEGPDMKSWKWEGPMIDRDNFPGFDGDVFVLGGRRIGVSSIELTKQLADYMGVTGGKGVLVTSVTENGPAAKAGLRAGDVITAVDGEAIDSPGDISRIINQKKEGAVTLTIIRNKSPQTIMVTPNDRKAQVEMGQPQVGRRIVIPRIEIPSPDVEIMMPRIQIPSIPAINIEMPRIRVSPRIRVVKTDRDPI